MESRKRKKLNELKEEKTEVHNDPANAKCDGEQSITPERFDKLMKSLRAIANIENKEL